MLIVPTARDLAEAECWDAVTTRRLAARIEYSKPVLYSHFSGKDANTATVAEAGFAEVADELPGGPDRGGWTQSGLLTDVASAYAEFAQKRPAQYDAMFTNTVDLPFASPEAPVPLAPRVGRALPDLAPFRGRGRSGDPCRDLLQWPSWPAHAHAPRPAPAQRAHSTGWRC